MATKFIIMTGPQEGQEKELEGGETWVIGREQDSCDWALEDPSISPSHVRISQTPHGYTLENLDANNPILVNGEVQEEIQVLNDEDSVQIGDTTLRFSLQEEEPVEEREEEAPPSEEEASAMEEEDSSSEQELERETEEFPEEEEAVEVPEVEDSIFEDEEEGLETGKDIPEVHFELSESGRFVMKVISGPNAGAEFPLEPNKRYLIGTDPATCDVVFQDISVSRQHAEISVTAEEEITIEDKASRNGVWLDGDRIEGSISLEANHVVTIGTTTFLIYDREGEATTIIPPTIKSTQSFMIAPQEQSQEELPPEEKEEPVAEEPKQEELHSTSTGAMLLLALVAGLFVLVAIGATSLFRVEEVKPEVETNYQTALQGIMSQYPTVKYSYSPNTGTLLLIGHVSSSIDRSQLLYSLQEMKGIRNIDDNIIIDEFIWQEQNQIMGKNANWQGVTMHSPSPGVFVLNGFLKTRDQLDSLLNYLSLNFAYIDLLDQKVVVEEVVLTEVDSLLQDAGLIDVAVRLTNGELTLTGTISYAQTEVLNSLLARFKQLQGIKNVKSFVVELAAEESMINLTSQYEVTGWSYYGDTSLNVVINGRILARGDVLDGMTITSIRQNVIFLEKDGFKYRIDYNN